MDRDTRWLEEASTYRQNQSPRWRWALYLYCVLVDKRMEEIVPQILGQNGTCKPHVEEQLAKAGVRAALERVLKAPPAS
jgi:hypothetical protein